MPEWKINDTTHVNPYLQCAVGGVLHPDTKMWQLWISFDGYNINWVAAYRNPERINSDREELHQLVQQGERFSTQKALTILNKFYEGREAEPQPLPLHIEESVRLNMRWKGRQ